MSLYGSIKEVQRTTEKFYLKLEQRFRGNKLIAELWSQMAQDVSQQIVNLHELPKSFWIHLKKDQDTLLNTIKTEVTPQNIENTSELSLSDCIESAIRSEEAIILKIYVPIIRNLRKNWTGRELDFYIMVKAHTVRIKRVAEAFSGDPIVLQHSSLLFQRFEKEIQEPEVEVILKKRPARKSGSSRAKAVLKAKVKPKSASKPKSVRKTKVKPKSASKPKSAPKAKVKPKAASKPKSAPKTKVKPKATSKAKAAPKKSPKQNQSRASRSKMRRSHSKPLVKKTSLRRSRARR